MNQGKKRCHDAKVGVDVAGNDLFAKVSAFRLNFRWNLVETVLSDDLLSKSINYARQGNRGRKTCYCSRLHEFPSRKSHVVLLLPQCGFLTRGSLQFFFED